MKGLGKVLLGFTVLTGALLFYVHERIEMLRVSYQIHEKSSVLAQRSEEYRRLNFEVAQLRSPQKLEQRLQDLSLPLALPKEIQVLRVPLSLETKSLEALPLEPPTRGVFKFLGQWIQVAQARTDQS